MKYGAARPDSEIVVCCASRDRPESLLEAVRSFVTTSTYADMKVYVDSDQIHDYLDSHDWAGEFGTKLQFTVDTRVGPNAAINRLYEQNKANYRIFGVIPDDSRFMRKGWDEYVIRTIDSFPGNIGVVSPAHTDGDYCAYPYVTREWIDIVGWYAMPQAHSFVWDTCIEMLGEATNIVYASSDDFYMFHECRKSENFEQYLKMDEHAFLAWCVVSRRAIVKKLRAAQQSALRPQGCMIER